MAHRLAPQVAVELDDIWYYIARDSGSIEIADRLIDSITDRFSAQPSSLRRSSPRRFAPRLAKLRSTSSAHLIGAIARGNPVVVILSTIT